MNRKNFISFSLKSCAAAALFGCYNGCSDGGNPVSIQNIEADFIIDLSDPANGALANSGGSLYKNGVIISKISDGNFAAVAQTCTHQGTTLQFELSNNRFHCPNHGSNFNFDGIVLNGPATRNLQKLNTFLDGNNLRIFS